MTCRECGSEMYKDDEDIRFKGCKDIYWNCPNCITSCIVEIRYFQKCKERWHSENNGVKDGIIRYKIKVD